MSTNDFTDALLKKLNGIESGAQKNEEGTVIDNNYVHTDNNFTDAEKNKIAELQQENTELSNNMPWNTTSGKSLHITDSAKYSKNKLSISGDMEQENLLNIEDATITSKGITSIAKSGVLNINGTTIADWFDITSGSNKIKVDLKSNIEYALDINKALPSGIVLVARFYNEDNENVVQSVRLENGSTRVTFTLSKNIERCYFTTTNCAIGQVVSVNDLKIKMFAVEIKTTTGVQKIRQFRKNFIPYPYTDSTMTARGINYVSNSNGSISISGTSNSNVADFYLFGNSTNNGNYLHLKQDTYSLKDTGNTNIIYIAREKTLGVLVGINTILQALKTQDCYFYGFFVRVNNGATVNTVIYPQLALGNTDTDYEPYWEQIHTLDLGTIQLCAIKDVNGNVVARDRAVYRNGKWQWEKNIGKYMFNGTETWNQNAVYPNCYYNIADREIKNIVQNNNNVRFYCNLYKYLGLYGSTGDVKEIGVYAYKDGKGEILSRVNFYTDINTLDEWKTLLQEMYTNGTPLTVYYPLETSEYEDCTADQSAVLDKIYNNFKLNKGVNNIIVESENGVGVNLELEYMQDLQTKLNLLEAMCVSNASQEV